MIKKKGANMETKDFKSEFDVSIKEWKYEAYAAIKNNIDSMQERIRDGAFTKTLKERFPKGLIKAFWRHRDPMGLPTHIEEDSKGLYTVTKVSETRTNEEYMILMRDKVVDRMSIGYDVIKDDIKEGIRDLLELKLYEYSPVPIAANEDAMLISVKSLDNLFGNFSLLLDRLEDRVQEMKPYPNEHSARLKNPNLFDPDTFRRKADGTIYGKIKVPSTASVIWAKLKEHNKPSDNPHPQAIRFPIESWTVVQAKKWLEDNNVKYERFEPASKELLELKGATPFADLPLGDRAGAWGADEAEGRVRSWAGGPDKEDVSWDKYRKAFFWYDAGDKENFRAYKLGFADIISGTLTAVPRGVFAAAAAVQGARGGVDLPSGDISGVKAHIEKYYAKMRSKFDDENIVAPWGKELKEGRVLSSANRQKLVDAVSVLQEILKMSELDREKELENFVKLIEDMRDLRVSFRY